MLILWIFIRCVHAKYRRTNVNRHKKWYTRTVLLKTAKKSSFDFIGATLRRMCVNLCKRVRFACSIWSPIFFSTHKCVSHQYNDVKLNEKKFTNFLADDRRSSCCDSGFYFVSILFVYVSMWHFFFFRPMDFGLYGETNSMCEFEDRTANFLV